jgi:hypothetical protein
LPAEVRSAAGQEKRCCAGTFDARKQIADHTQVSAPLVVGPQNDGNRCPRQHVVARFDIVSKMLDRDFVD